MSPRYAVALALALAVTWLVWSGHFDLLLLSLGAASCLLVVALALRMGIVDREAAPLHLPIGLVTYIPWLVWEIVKANLDVALRILRPDLPIDPRVIRVKAGQSSDIARTIYANSITLTPGTVSIETEGEVITVHALTAESAAGVLSGEMDRRVTRLEGEA